MKILKFLKQLLLNDKFILIVILINSVTIFGEGFTSLPTSLEQLILLIDIAITILFLLEAIVKINHYGWKKYMHSNWNKLDFVLVVLSTPSIFLYVADLHFANLSFLYIFRISRVFKFFRFFKFIPGIDQLIKGVSRAIKTSVFVLTGFMVYNFVVSVLSCYLYKDVSPQYFGDPFKAFYSTFRIFTVEGWYEIPEQIAVSTDQYTAFFTMVYFIIILISGGILGLSLVNSIFVDAMVSDNNDELEKKVELLHDKIDALMKIQNKNTHKS